MLLQTIIVKIFVSDPKPAHYVGHVNGTPAGRLRWPSLNTSTASTIRDVATQHRAGKALSLLSGRWLKRAPGAARKRDRSKLEALLEDVEESPPLLHPNMSFRYRAQVGQLIETLNSKEHRAEAIDAVRSLIEKIVLTPDESENRLVADLHGSMAGILALSDATKSKSQLTNAALEAHKAALGLVRNEEIAPEGASQVKLVAGVGFEPTTFRL